MPKEGYATITLKQWMYDELSRLYTDRSLELSMMGIHSMSGLFIRVLSDWLSKHDIDDLMTPEERQLFDKLRAAGATVR